MINIFISYSRQDVEFAQKIDLVLSPLKRTGQVDIWDDRKIRPGEEWDSAIKNSLNKADIILLLISPNYLASDYLTEVEMGFAFHKMVERDVAVIPIIIRPCIWQDTPIGQLQVLPRSGKALNESASIDDELISLVKDIKRVIDDKESKKNEIRKETASILHHGSGDVVSGNKNINHNIEPAKTIQETLLQITQSIALLFEEVKTIKNNLESHKTQNSDNILEEKRHMDKNVKYQVGLSFAGEDRTYVSKVADELLKLQLLVFYDEYETVDLWGKDLYQHLSDVYKNKCQYCVIFISKYYAEKLWTKHELKNAQAKAFEENREYILPARFDNTELPGMLPTVGYVNCNKLAPSELAQKIYEKVLRTPVS